jgi:hypothetical protein
MINPGERESNPTRHLIENFSERIDLRLKRAH